MLCRPNVSYNSLHISDVVLLSYSMLNQVGVFHFVRHEDTISQCDSLLTCFKSV
jgi:hypothetical protein